MGNHSRTFSLVHLDYSPSYQKTSPMKRGYDLPPLPHHRDGRAASKPRDESTRELQMQEFLDCSQPEAAGFETRDEQRGETDGVARDDEAVELDEFGRLVPSVKKSFSIPSTSKPEWPPCFCDRHAVDYVLDARSGMFYHAGSDFFYDPKSKLYYGNKQKRYFRHVEKSTSQYEPVEEEQDTTTASGSMSLEPEAILDPQCRTSSSGSSISINLKTKKLPAKKTQQTKHTRDTGSVGSGSQQSVQTATTSSVSVASKQHSENIDKWQERRQELVAAEPSTALTATTLAPVTTKAGEPVCLLCKRKFQTLDQLRRHEELSQLHKDNLQRVTTSNGSDQQRATDYVDRAQNRRAMHGDLDMAMDSVAALALAAFPDDSRALVATATETTRAATTTTTFDPFGSQNVGRQMLQGMGWKQDSAADQSQREGLAKEWDRIETSMARTKQPQHPR